MLHSLCYVIQRHMSLTDPLRILEGLYSSMNRTYTTDFNINVCLII